MNILIICTNADEAGAPKHVEIIVNGLKEKFNFCLIFGEDGPVAKRLRQAGFSVMIINQMQTKINFLYDFITLFKTILYVAKFNPNVIHCHSAKAGMVGRLAAFIFRKPWLYTVHGWGWRGMPNFKKNIIIFIERLLSKLPKGYYIFVSRSVLIDAKSLINLKNNNFKLIYNGVPQIIVKPEINNSIINICMPARVCAAKDHTSLLLAFEKLNSDAVKLILCGAGTNDIEFINFAKKLAPRSHKNISFLGEVSDINNIYSHSHIVALISNFEALPLSIIEAMSCSRAIVATSVGGLPELITTNFNGILVRQNSVNDIFNALSFLLDPAVRMNLGANARATYDTKFNSEIMLSAIAENYKLVGELNKSVK